MSFPVRQEGESVEDFVRRFRNFQRPEPPRVDREERKFNNYREAEIRLGRELPPNVRKCFAQPRIEQRTPKWFAARGDAITSSDFAAAIGANPWQSPHKLVEKKTIGSAEFGGNWATEYGVLNEDRALHRYEQETGAFTFDFGLVSHHKLFEELSDEESLDAQKQMEWFVKMHQDENMERWTWLKGSPDGLAVLPDGRNVLVEIKCPVSKFVRQKISSYYYPQVQLLMWLMDLEECHFVQYNPPDDFHEEKFDLLVVPRNREWMDAAVTVARATWEAILFQRKNGCLNQVVLQNTSSQPSAPRSPTELFPACVSFAAKKNPEIPYTKLDQLKKAQFVPDGKGACVGGRAVGKNTTTTTSISDYYSAANATGTGETQNAALGVGNHESSAPIVESGIGTDQVENSGV
jgi:hypothetical protein